MSCRAKEDGRVGFTLVELLVVIGIIGLLVGLLLPAVQNIREAGNRVSCTNNLHQISHACLHYSERLGALPPSRREGEGPTWAWLILPDLDQENLFRKWPANTPMYLVEQNVVQSALPVYFCPSRRSAVGAETKQFTQHAGCLSRSGVIGAPGDYAACIGTTGADNPQQTSLGIVPPTGIFVEKKGLRYHDIKDGFSNTLLVGEKHVPLDRFGEWPLDCSLWDGHNPSCSMRCGGADYTIVRDRRAVAWAFGSYHPGICQFAFADGRVERLRDTIDPVILGLLSHRSDGMAIPPY